MAEAARALARTEALDTWSSLRSQISFLTDHRVFPVESVDDITQTVSDLEDFFPLLDPTAYVIGICDRIHEATRVLLPRLARLIARDNFAELLADLVVRFERYYLAVQASPAAGLRAYDQLLSFWEQLKTTHIEAVKPEHDLMLYAGGLAYMVGAISTFDARTELKDVPGLAGFPEDVVKLSDVVGLMGRYQRARMDWDRFWAQISAVIFYFLGVFASTLVTRTESLNDSTRRLVKLAEDFEREERRLRD